MTVIAKRITKNSCFGELKEFKFVREIREVEHPSGKVFELIVNDDWVSVLSEKSYEIINVF